MSMSRVVFDTVVFVRALINPYNYAGQLLFTRANEYTLVLSPPIIQGILEVLSRPEISRKFRAVAGIDLRQVIDLFATGEIVEFDEIPSASRDPKDDTYLVTARVGKAEFLVSEDRHLLDLSPYDGIEVIDTVTFLGLLAGTPSE